MKYVTLGALTLPAGTVLGLSESQAAPRKHVLRAVPARKGWYTATGEVQFKIGEEITCDGDLPKHLAQLLAPATKPTPAPVAKD
jgi:hypothetical protein